MLSLLKASNLLEWRPGDTWWPGEFARSGDLLWSRSKSWTSADGNLEGDSGIRASREGGRTSLKVSSRLHAGRPLLGGARLTRDILTGETDTISVGVTEAERRAGVANSLCGVFLVLRIGVVCAERAVGESEAILCDILAWRDLRRAALTFRRQLLPSDLT